MENQNHRKGDIFEIWSPPHCFLGPLHNHTSLTILIYCFHPETSDLSILLCIDTMHFYNSTHDFTPSAWHSPCLGLHLANTFISTLIAVLCDAYLTVRAPQFQSLCLVQLDFPTQTPLHKSGVSYIFVNRC